MDLEPGWAVVAGLIGGAAMAVILYMGIFMMPRQMKMNMLMLLGDHYLPPGAVAFLMGAMVHAGMGAVFGLVHAAAFSLADIDSAHAAWRLLFGVVHWAVVGIALSMLPLMRPRIPYDGPRLVPVAQRNPHTDRLLDAPGSYALAYPPMTAMGFLILHLLFGVIFDALNGNGLDISNPPTTYNREENSLIG